jgi:hypothetical protein
MGYDEMSSFITDTVDSLDYHFEMLGHMDQL